jgi:hypothetical protein
MRGPQIGAVLLKKAGAALRWISRVFEEAGAEPKAFAAGHSLQATRACRRRVRHPKVKVDPLEGHPQAERQGHRQVGQSKATVDRGWLACRAADDLFPSPILQNQIANAPPVARSKVI